MSRTCVPGTGCEIAKSGFGNLGRTVLALASATVLASLAAAQRPLTLTQRIACREKVEDVYWAHRTWPAENKTPKPPRELVVPHATIAARVKEALRYEAALGEVFQQPLSPEVIQTEMDRQARRTQDPQMLRELWAALGNNPYLVAECLVRPELAERRIKERYTSDSGLHAETRARAERELALGTTLEGLRSGSGEVQEIEWVKGGDAAPSAPRPGVLELPAEDWKRLTSRLAAILAPPLPLPGLAGRGPALLWPAALRPVLRSVPLLTWSALQEGEDRFYVQSLRSRSRGRARVETVSWPKTSFESWWANERDHVLPAEPEPAGYALTSAPAGGCNDDTWAPTSTSPPIPRYSHTAVWTGTEMIVWGGYTGGSPLNTGGKYTPSTDIWVATTTGANVPAARDSHTAVWTGSEMIVWGGYDGTSPVSTGGRYSPSLDRWTATSVAGAVPAGRYLHTAVWTGSEMIVWGGNNGGSYLNTGGRYTPGMAPGTDSWVTTGTGANLPAARYVHTAVWTGSEMIVWSGYNGSHLNTGGRYTPGTDSWVATSTGANLPAAREFHTAVWTGSEMIVWGGEDNVGNPLNTGGRYAPGSDSWSATSTGANVPAGRDGHTALWTGSQMIVWGGFNTVSLLNTGGRYTPGSDSWAATGTGSNLPAARSGPSAVWTGSEMIVWGGIAGGGSPLNTGGRYTPGTDSWLATGMGASPPAARYAHTAVWTGSEMIVWGGWVVTGSAGGHPLNTGGRYTPATDSWVATSTSPASRLPAARYLHTAVWTGTDMIIWGGFDGTISVNTGGRYAPGTDSWTGTSTSASVPTARSQHTAVWTGSEMIVWGGEDNVGNPLNTGGRYAPGVDHWTGTSVAGAVPAGRFRHATVWTGSEMIVWGGALNSGYANTGGLYTPGTDSWAATSTGANLPSARDSPSAVWTGSEMIVWGGYNGSYLNTGGRYTPGADSWVATSTGANLPSARPAYTTIWTGSEMIVWGGGYGTGALNTGGRYMPGANSWVATSTGGYVPDARGQHSAVWTGSELIVWGGYNGIELNTIGRYCASGLQFYTLTPCRVLDTRNAAGTFGGPAIPAAGGQRTFPFAAASCLVPADARAVSVNVTVVGPGSSGYLNAFSSDLAAPPATWVMTFSPGQTRANNAIVQVSSDGNGTVTVLNGSSTSVNVVVDVNGYFR